MATKINKEKMEPEINNEFQIVFSEESHSDSTIRCHLSPSMSAVDMEIRWFKETDCVCFYKNRRLIEGESYKGMISLCKEELERGVVCLQLKDVRESCDGYYLCQVTSGDRTAEISIRASCFPTALQSHEDHNQMSQKITPLRTKQSEKKWTKEERIKMLNSALLAVFNSLEKTDLQKEDLQGINATVQQTDVNAEEKQEKCEEEDTQQECLSGSKKESGSLSETEMEISNCKPEEQETKPGNSCLDNHRSSQTLPDSDEFQIAFSEESQSDSTIQCHLSPSMSAVDMEIRWFKETDCVCFYKNRRLIEGESYKGMISLCKEELERGVVCLQLKDVRESCDGYYLCQVTSGDRTAEISIRASCFPTALQSHEDQNQMSQKITPLQTKQSEKKWTKDERIKMVNSALLAVFNSLEKTDLQKEDPQDINATVQQTDVNAEEKQEKCEDEDTQQECLSGSKKESGSLSETEMEISNCKPEEQETKPGNSCLDNHRSSQTLPDSDLQKEDPQDINATVQQTDVNVEEKQEKCEEEDTQQECLSGSKKESGSLSETEMETNNCETEEQETKPGNSCLGNQRSSQTLPDSDVKVCIFRTGKTNSIDKDFTDVLRRQIENLKEVPEVSQSDIILVFCPVVSRAGTDIDNALEIFNSKTETKLAVLVVLHHTFDPEKTVPDSRRCVNRTDILTVDCLFNEDSGLLPCQKNSDAADKVVNWLIQQRGQTGVKLPLCQNLTTKDSTKSRQIQNQESERRKKEESLFQSFKTKMAKMENNETSTKKVFSILAGKINCHKEFVDILRKRIGNLKEGHTVEESDIILVFCPIVSRAGTDIDAALNNFVHCTGSKLTVLVVLHHTFDPERTVPDSSRYVNRTDILTVDFLFFEDSGLLQCQKNSDAADKTVNWLIQQGPKINITLSPYKSSSFPNIWTSRAQGVGFPKPKSNYPRPVDYIVYVTKDTSKCDAHFINALQRQVQLRRVRSEQNSQIILIFCPVCSPSDIHATLQTYHKRPGKPVVFIFLHYTLDSDSVPNSSGRVNSQNVFVVDCIFCGGEGLPECKQNREAISAVADWIKNKFGDH